LKILLVEDNVTFRKTFKKVLIELFPAMSVEEAGDGVEALAKIQWFTPDLIFMDIRLPEKNGLELTKMIKQSHPETAVVLLTDYNLPEYREAAFASGADDFVIKGTLNPAAVAALVKSIFQDRKGAP